MAVDSGNTAMRFDPRLVPCLRNFSYRWGRSYWRIHRGLRRRLVFENAIQRIRGCRFWDYACPESIGRDFSCQSVGELPTFAHRVAAQAYHLARPFVAEIPDVRLVGKHAAPITADGKLLLTAFRDAPRILGLESHPDILAELEKPAGSDASSLTAFSMVNRLDGNYFHWLVETCAQLEGVEHYEAVTGLRPSVIIRSGGPKFQRASLELLGMPSGRITEWDGNEALPVKRLVVCSLPGNRVALSARSLQWLRRRFLRSSSHGDSTGGKSRRKIYIRRRERGWRNVKNDDEVIALLRNRGFEIIDPGELPLNEQINIFAEAEIVVGLHGAGLTNLLFAPHATLVELIGSYGNGEYYSMARCLGQPYTVLSGQPDGPDEYDVMIDLKRLERFLAGVDQSSQRSLRLPC